MNTNNFAPAVATAHRQQRIGLAVLAIVAVGALGICFHRDLEDGEWYNVFARAANRMLAGECIHRHEPNAYAYPPLMALVTIPLARLGMPWGLIAWYLVNMFALAVLLRAAWKLVGGPPAGTWNGRWQWVFGLACLLSSRFCMAPFENQQFDVVIAALVMMGCTALVEGRSLAAACWLGASAGMKCTPLLFGAYLVWRGRVLAAAVMLLVAVGLNRLADVVCPQTSGASYLADWMHVFLGTLGREPPGAWYSDLLLNQSLAGLWSRYVQIGWPLSAADLPSGPLVPSAAVVAALRWLVYGSLLLLGALTAWRMMPPGWPIRRVEANADGPSSRGLSLRLAWEMALVLCLMLLASPMSSKAHYVVLVLPCLLVSRIVVERRGWRRWSVIGVLACLGPLSAGEFTGDTLGDLLLAWGGPTWFVLVLLGFLWWHVPAWPSQAAACATANARRVAA